MATNVVTVIMNFLTIHNDAELMAERSKVGADAKSWDKIILGLSSLTYLTGIIVAGLDSGRYQSSPIFHWTVYAAGVALMLIGQTIFLSARKENKYFSSVVRIQSDRGHSVCDTGVYRLVRHPGYMGMMFSLAAIPLLTGSVWSVIPITCAVILLFVRTYLEDETLKHELHGYTEYAQKVRHRLIPKIW